MDWQMGVVLGMLLVGQSIMVLHESGLDEVWTGVAMTLAMALATALV